MVRKLSIIAAMLLGLGLAGHAADTRVGTSSNTPFVKGTSILSIKMGAGSDYYFNFKRKNDHYNNGRSPVVALAYEYGISELAGIGYISLGAEGGLAHAKHYKSKDWASEANIYHIGMTCNYHFDFNMITKEPVFEKLDLYAGLGMFLRVEDRTATESTAHHFDGVIQYTRQDALVNGCIGARYFFTDKVAAMLQLGTSLAGIEAGVTFKL